MSEERWDRLRQLFHHALDLPLPDRDAFVKSCSDASLRNELESLLGGADGHVLDSPVLQGVREAIKAAINDTANIANSEGVGSTQSVSGARSLPPDFGNYHILGVLGEGGMGIVYLAEQRQPIRRRIALKVLKHGDIGSSVAARFESESQALALMDHINIAHVFDAGTTSTGQPYFAMEYVPGIPITDYCDRFFFNFQRASAPLPKGLSGNSPCPSERRNSSRHKTFKCSCDAE